MRLTHPKARVSSASRTGSIRQRVALASLLLAVGSIATATANTYTVGLQGCTHGTIQSAVTTAENNPGPDTIRIARSANYSAQAININTSQELTLTGGFANCAATEDSTYTTLDGSGGAAAPVINIIGNTGSLIRIRKLTITGGDASSNGTSGGGIQWKGNGLLDIADTALTANQGAYGGGIRADGVGDAAELDIGPNTTISGNGAYYDGGGIYSGGLETAIRGENIVIVSNEATGVGSSGGYGGGILIRACDLISRVYLGSSGAGGLPTVYFNSARYGGGVAIATASGCSKAAELRMYSTAAGVAKITGNSASISGGGVYISRASGTATVYARGGSIESNDAPVASALWLGDGGSAYFNTVPASFGFGDNLVDCAVGTPCGSISGNSSSNGQVIYGADNNIVGLTRMAVTGNDGKELIRVNQLAMSDTLIADNTSTLRLLETHKGYIARSTIVDNQVGGSQVVGVDTGGTFTMNTSVAWQPGKLILHNDGAVPVIYYNIVNELSSLSGSNTQNNRIADPRLIDPHASGDYRPTAASPVIDFYGGVVSENDLLNLPRGVDLPLVVNLFGANDVGAYERQALQPLVENGEFSNNARVWVPFSAAASFDASQNAPGSTGGSLHMKLAGGGAGAVQCIHLPGPGDYALNGSGKIVTGGPGDTHYASLTWELRLVGSETCTGIPDATGGRALAASGDSAWHRPTTPMHIVVTPQQFTNNTSIAVYLKTIEQTPAGASGANSPSVLPLVEGWIDHVVLDLGADDIIFKNGFDAP